jgi:putative ABC transport system permease protein
MSRDHLLAVSDRWFRLLLRLYPADFRDDMGEALVETYRDRAREALRRGRAGLAAVWLRAFADSLRNGLGERARPAASWRRGSWGREAELVTRRLARAPAFVAATTGTLTVGLGMFAVVFTVVQKVLIDPMPYRNPQDLYYVWRDYGSALDLKRGSLLGADVAELQGRTDVIEDAVALQPFLGGVFSLREDTDPMEIAVTVTSPRLFALLGVAPALGRTFGDDEVGPKRPNVIVLSHELWSRLGADPTLVGTDVRLNGRSYRVIGVLPRGFSFVRHDALGPPQHVDAYTTFEVGLREMPPNRSSCAGLIRARRGTSAQAVAAAVDAVGRDIDARDFHGRGLRLYPVGLKPDLVSRIRPALLVLGSAGVVLFLMLMVNLASVLLARAAQREHEFAVRRALGASSVAVVRAMLLEGGALGLLGGGLGALAAVWGTRALVALAPLDLPRRETIAIDGRIGAVVVGLGALLGFIAATVPATWAGRASLSSLLARSAVRGGDGHGRLRRGMVVAQVALSLVLLSSGALVVRSFERLLRADPGFRPEGLLSVRVRTPPEFFPTVSDTVAFQDRLQRTLATLPGVTGASAAGALPLTATAAQTLVELPGAPGNTGDKDRDTLLVDVIPARAGYVEVMGMRLLAGRTFGESRPDGVREAIIDRAVAARFFPGGDPIGAQIRYGGSLSVGPGTLTIVGVVQQARLYDVHQDGRPQLIVRAEDWGVRPLLYVLRSRRAPQALLPEVQAAVRRLDPRVAAGDPRTLEEIVDNALRPQRTSAALIAAFALGALLLAAMGLFGVVAGSVTRRRHELAVRLALGADHHRVLRLVLAESATLVGIALLVGLPGVYAAGRLIRGALVGVSPSDPATLLAVTLGLAAVTMATCYVPARRVLEIEPAQLLRGE